MGKLSLFEVSYSKERPVYYPGEPVEGQVTVELNDTMKMRGMHLRFKGMARVHWTEERSSGSRTIRTDHFSAEEEYFYISFLLAGRWKDEPGHDINLPAGRHTYPFSYKLPSRLPSSFAGAYGFVGYDAKCTIDKPWKFNHEAETSFIVRNRLDLNREPRAKKPNRRSKSKTLCCLCCTSGPISATFSIDRQGYVIGEEIIINAEIENLSNKRVKKSKVVLMQEVLYHATTKTKPKTHDYAKLKHGEIKQGDTDYWNAERLVVPPLTPSFLRGCKIIDVRYFLMLDVTPAGPSSDLVLYLNVIIGNIPRQGVVAQPSAVDQPAAHQPSGKGASKGSKKRSRPRRGSAYITEESQPLAEELSLKNTEL
ncbi:arrestin domain-containing protein 3-like isoform X1 [Haliotis rubra]|uniref:arrestin domain-containing protein 3-like isoform X1 n=1 Tax=Haliotis rubra TaxID=36100 RepID=UPI001EE51517|nr:arrestin domain-containing protein 3-like isoform X1 [Haliotis rubra]